MFSYLAWTQPDMCSLLAEVSLKVATRSLPTNLILVGVCVYIVFANNLGSYYIL